MRISYRSINAIPMCNCSTFGRNKYERALLLKSAYLLAFVIPQCSQVEEVDAIWFHTF